MADPQLDGSGTVNPPFGGFDAGDYAWPESRPMPMKRRHQKKVDAGEARLYQVAVRVEPKHPDDLLALAADLAAALSYDIGEPKDGDRAIAMFFDYISSSPHKAVDGCAFRVGRIMRKVNIPVGRVLWDVREAVDA